MKQHVHCPHCGGELELELPVRPSPKAKPAATSRRPTTVQRPPRDLRDRIVELVRREQPGSPLLLRELRASLAGVPWLAVNDALRALLRQHDAPVFFLQHDLPSSASAAERRDWLENRGTWYHAIALRSAPLELTPSALYAEAAKLPASQRFGGAKAFLGPLLARFGTTPQAVVSQLADWHRQGSIVLARADLVSAMDPALVQSSEIASPSVPGITWHFLAPR